MKGSNKADVETSKYKQTTGNYNQEVLNESDDESDSKNSKNNVSDEHRQYIIYINIIFK